MDRRVWYATVHGVTRVWHDWATKPPPLKNGIAFQWGEGTTQMHPYSDSYAPHLPQTLAPKARTHMVREMTSYGRRLLLLEQCPSKTGHLLGSHGFEMTGSTYQNWEWKRTGPSSCLNACVPTHLVIRGIRFLVSIIKHSAFLQRKKMPTWTILAWKEEFIMNKYILHLLDDWDARKQRVMSAPHYKESEGVAHDLPQGV